MFLNKNHFIIFMIVLIFMMSVGAATNVDDSNTTHEVINDTESSLETNNYNSYYNGEKYQKNNFINKNKSSSIKTINEQSTFSSDKESEEFQTENNTLQFKEDFFDEENNIKLNAKNSLTVNQILLTPENFDTYVTDGKFNDNVPVGASIDLSGKFDGEHYAFKITKPVNLYSSAGDAFLCFYSTQNLEQTYGTPNRSFQITTEGSGTNITGLYFENTMIVTTEAHDIIFDNLTVYCTNDYGWGLGATSIRNSQNVTIKNSYFNTTENRTWLSTVVFAASQNCLIENCTVTGSGLIGNLVYATTYNVEVTDEYGNSNITIRGNKIIGRELVAGVATCYSVCAKGDNITVENNYIENSNKFLVMSQYELADDEIYQADGSFGRIIIRNNTFSTGKMGLKFRSCTIINNTFYGNVTLDVRNNTIQENNVVQDATLNPYKSMSTAQEHDAQITIEAPSTYIYDEKPIINVSVVNEKTNNSFTSGQLEVYVDGTLYKNITVNSSKTSFTFINNTIGIHRLRIWYYLPGKTQSNSQKQVNIETTPVKGVLTLETNDNIHIGDTIPLTVSFTLNKYKQLTTNITYNLPGQQPIIIPAVNNQASINTTITTDYIRDILGGREQNIRITATTNDSNVEITGINTKLGVQKAQTVLTITPTTVQVNNQTTITAAINTPTNLTINKGTITFKDAENNPIGTYYVNNNQATITTQFNTIGTTQITATYSGTTYYEATTTTTPIEVTGKQEVIVTYEPISDVNFGENVTITGKFMTSNGKVISNSNVKIYINGVKYLIKTDKTGTYFLSVQTTQTGINKVSIGYSGNDKYEAYETNTTFTVLGKQPVIVTYEPINDVNFGENVTITGKFMTSNGKVISNSNVKIYINGVKYLVRTDKTGTYFLSVQTTQTGINKVSIGYSGNDKYEAYETNTTFTVTGKQPVIVTYEPIGNVKRGQNVTITGKFKTDTGKAISNSNVKIYINGVKYYAKTDNTGKYTLSAQANTLGINNVTIGYSGNNKYDAYETNTTFTVIS